MKRMIKAISAMAALIAITTGFTVAQKINEERMNRDIEVAENVLETLIKQKFGDNRMFFSLDINGNYQEGYGVTFSLPPNYTTPIAFSMSDFGDNVKIFNYNGRHVASDHRNRDDEDDNGNENDHDHDKDKNRNRNDRDVHLKLEINENQKERTEKLDSLRDSYNDRIIEASTEFLADYGDIISQLTDTERIVITNRGDRPKMWVGNIVNAPSRTHLSIEVPKATIAQFRQGKINRDQLIEKIKVVNTEAVSEVDPDLELLSSIFNRLYRSDLSKTFFADGNVYYERLKDFGAIYYMQVYSSNKTYNNSYDMPTIDKKGISQTERDQQVKALYPTFEKELKENLLEYGRTVKSLGNDESLIVNVAITKCTDCGIPSSLEVSVKASVLKEYNAGKLDVNGALSKMNVKKVAAR